MALKCFDYECETCKIFFDRFLDTTEESGNTATCDSCGRIAQRVFICPPKVDSLAFAAWNGVGVDSGFSDKTKFRDHLERKGKLIKEPGLEKDAEENEKRFLKKKHDEFDKKFDTYFKDRYGDKSSEQMKQILAVDKQIHEATISGNGNAIKAMGGLTSLDEAYERANSK